MKLSIRKIKIVMCILFGIFTTALIIGMSSYLKNTTYVPPKMEHYPKPLPGGESVRVAIPADCYPFVYLENDDTPAGFGIEQLVIVSEQTGISLDFTVMERNELVPSLQSNSVDVIMMFDKNVGLTEEENIRIYVAGFNEIVAFGKEQADSVNGIQNKRIAHRTDGSVRPYLQKLGMTDLKTYGFFSEQAALQAVENGECDYAVMNYVTGLKLIQDNFRQLKLDVQLFVGLSESAIGINTTGETSARFAKGWEEMMKTTTYTDISGKWCTLYRNRKILPDIAENHVWLLVLSGLVVMSLFGWIFAIVREKRDTLMMKEAFSQTNMKENEYTFAETFSVMAALSKDYVNVDYVRLKGKKAGESIVNFRSAGILDGAPEEFEFEYNLGSRIASIANHLVVQEDRERFIQNVSMEQVTSHVRKGETYDVTVRITHRGELHHMQLKFIPITNTENHRPEGIVVGARIIDAEIAAESERQQLQSVIETLSDNYECLISVDYEGNDIKEYRASVLYAQMSEYVKAGMNNAELVQEFAKLYVVPEDREIFLKGVAEQFVWENVQEGQVYSLNFRLKTTDGDQWYQSKFVHSNPQNDFRRVLVALVNINEQVSAVQKQKQELEKAMNAEKEANAAKSRFLFNMSHDIRTPMNAILGFADIAEHNISNPDVLKDALHKIEVSGNDLLQLINEVLDMARIESGKLELEYSIHNVVKRSQELADIFAVLMKDRKQVFLTDFENIRNPYVWFDTIHVRQIMTNLLSNAIKYTPVGGTIRYVVQQLPEETEGMGKFRFTVEDTGVGMSEEYLAHIFDMFSRENTSTISRREGSGLGMSIVKNLVDLMNGTIEIKSKPNVGTRVDVTLELKLASEQDKVNPSEKTEQADYHLEGIHVLMVEDIELNREIARDMLEREGVIVTEAENGQEAFEIINGSAPGEYDLILMDIQMPVMDGYEATRRIRTLPNPDISRIPIIAMTANAFAEDRKASFDAGMNDHISKPLRKDTLNAVLAKYSGNSAAETKEETV